MGDFQEKDDLNFLVMYFMNAGEQAECGQVHTNY